MVFLLEQVEYNLVVMIMAVLVVMVMVAVETMFHANQSTAIEKMVEGQGVQTGMEAPEMLVVLVVVAQDYLYHLSFHPIIQV
jgi:ABC-type Fe3+-citrate transport system substrate-binding protein